MSGSNTDTEVVSHILRYEIETYRRGSARGAAANTRPGFVIDIQLPYFVLARGKRDSIARSYSCSEHEIIQVADRFDVAEHQFANTDRIGYIESVIRLFFDSSRGL